MIEINIPNDVEFILNKINQKGFEAYIVGGCVRDSILGLEPKDWDITTSAEPQEIIELFKGFNIIPTGLKHGTVTIMINNIGYEITTYRIDGEYDDNRHPKEVTYTSNLKEDLARRDFTINAMAYNDKEGLKDYFNGYTDLIENKIIKTVGNPIERFKEDALRMLRAIRFSAKFNFKIDLGTKFAIKELSSNIVNISKERIREEFNKILYYDSGKILQINRLGLSKFICEEFKQMENHDQNNPYHTFDLLNHSITSTEIATDLKLKLVMIFHDIGKLYCKMVDEKGVSHYKGHSKISTDRTRDILKELKYSNDIIDYVCTLIELHDYNFAEDSRTIKKQLKRLLNKYNEQIVKDLLKVRVCDISAQNLKYLYNRLEKIHRVSNILDDILNSSECFTIKDLDIDGYDIMSFGYKGKEIGNKLEEILNLVIEEKLPNRRYQIKNYLKNDKLN